MRKLFLALTAVLAGAAVYFGYPFFLRNAFRVSGVIYISPKLAQQASRPNNVLFIIAKDAADIPVAVRRVVNPVFPLKFQINSNDLLLHDPWKSRLRLEAQLNDHGRVGDIRPGDMIGKSDYPVFFWTRDLYVTIDKTIDISARISSMEDSGRADRMFSMPSK